MELQGERESKSEEGSRKMFGKMCRRKHIGLVQAAGDGAGA